MAVLGQDGLAQIGLAQIETAAAPSTQVYGGAFSSFSAPMKVALTAAVIATTFVGFVAPPPAQARVFTSFSQPAKKVIQNASWNFVAAPAKAQTAIFTQFSQPIVSRNVLPDEQPSVLFEVAPPRSPPFMGFARFTEVLVSKSKVYLYSAFQPAQLFVPAPDTHDLVFMGDQFRKKKRKPDLIDEEIRRKAKLRADLELAIYGPEVVYEPPSEPVVTPPAPPPNVDELVRIAMEMRSQEFERQRKELEQDDDDVLDMILKDLG